MKRWCQRDQDSPRFARVCAGALLRPGGVLVVDFSGVEMMDYSFADEALGTLFSRMAAREFR